MAATLCDDAMHRAGSGAALHVSSFVCSVSLLVCLYMALSLKLLSSY